MKIVYVEDSDKARELAETASAEVGGLELTMHKSASEAYAKKAWEGSDFFLSDLFFKEDPDENIREAYERYIKEIEEHTQNGEEVGFTSYSKPLGVHSSYPEELYRMKHGKVSERYLEKCVEGTSKFHFDGTPEDWLKNYANLQVEYPLGAVLINEAWSNNTKGAILSQSHRHDIFLQAGGITALPLIKRFPHFFHDYDSGRYAGKGFRKSNDDAIFLGHSCLSPYILDFDKEEKEGFVSLFKGLKEILPLIPNPRLS